ncbi:MAG TPA: biotin/lipoyl-containing protein, partial [Acidimicrobiia bacterium]|nr:biotin/lipoyl-containing protein [Acidimicrobiia bacterium]
TDDFARVAHSTKWVEDEVDHATFGASRQVTSAPSDETEPLVERTVPVEVDGRRFEVKVWLPEVKVAASAAAGPKRPRPVSGTGGHGGAGSGTVSAPMQGTIVKVLVEVGAAVEVGQALLVLEAMKMENNINAETAGTVKEVRVAAGDGVGAGDVLVVIE